MTLEKFEDWLNNLPLQTLTDELKEDILANAKEVVEYTSDEVRVKINKEVNAFLRSKRI
jgi:hypothetical protein